MILDNQRGYIEYWCFYDYLLVQDNQVLFLSFVESYFI